MSDPGSPDAPDSREAILGAIRAKLGVRGDEAGRRGMARTRLDRAPAGIIPERAREDRRDLIKRFVTTLEAQGATVQRLQKRTDLPEAVADALRGLNLPLQLRMGDDPQLKDLPWDAAPFDLRHGAATGDDLTGLSRAIAAAAETGTLMLASGPDNPSTVNFLPETHMVLIAAEDIAGSYEDAWNRLREICGRGKMPRTVNLVSGPSRTADIEQTIIMGAHGPRRLFVFIAGR
jgi:L-lactate dehydrogenase complex protein LldG